MTRNNERKNEVSWDLFSTAMLLLDIDLRKRVSSNRREENFMKLSSFLAC